MTAVTGASDMGASDMEIAVTGASGRIGGRVAHRLSRSGPPLRLIGRSADRLPDLANSTKAIAADYVDHAAMRAAFDGCDTVFMVSGREDAERRDQHRALVESAIAAGVERLVYLSFQGAAEDCTFTFGRDHWYTEELIKNSGLRFTFLRDSFYLGMLPALAGPDGVIRGPGGDGRVAAVAHDDVADVVTAVLLSDDHDGRTYDVTGPAAISLTEAAAELSRVSGHPFRYQPETVEEAYASRAHFGAPAFEVDGWVTSYLAIARDEVSTVSDTVPALTGHPAQSLADYLHDHPKSYAHVTG